MNISCDCAPFFSEAAAAMDAVTEFRGMTIAILAVVDDFSVVPDAAMEAGRTAITLVTPVGDEVTPRSRPAVMTGGWWAMKSVPFHAAFIGRAAALSPGVVARTGHSHA